MITRFRTMSPRDSLGVAVTELLSGSQQDFPVVEDGHIAGLLLRNDLIKALATGARDASVAEVMCRECQPVDEGDLLTRTVESMRANRCATVPVVGGGRLVGLLTLENISEAVMVNAALTGNGAKTRDFASLAG